MKTSEPKDAAALAVPVDHSQIHYFRLQRAGITLSAMQRHRTREGNGVPCQLSMSDSFGGAWDAFEDDGEIVVLEGKKLRDLYDGVLLYPTRILARFSKGFFTQHLDEIAEYEEWEGSH